jgi:tetratricopeptide (TPR) repeat protein
MGTVHAAEVAEAVASLEPGRKVAVKIVHPHLLASPGFFKRFMREAELGRKVVHENVVRTFDVDALLLDDKHVHYMVMEYVEGKSLRQLLLDLGTIPETLLREIALQTAAGLAAIHEAGVVHRDLKPENVLITDDHEIRIMDLGVAKLQEASIAITKEGQFAGSVLYAAPEQFGPDEVGPSVDLYSLGVMLYELATGDNPFRRDGAAAVIEAHVNHTPPRITDLNTETTSFLSELTAVLLAKKPADRFESAQMLHDVLREAERAQWWTELAPKLRKKVAHLPKIRVRRETKLHGRDEDLKALNAAWEKARRGEGNTVFIEGEAGIGKTRLVDAFLRGLDDRDIHVLYGSYPPSGGLGGVSEAILGKFGEVDLAGALAPYLTVTPSFVPTFAALVKHESPPTGADPLQGDALNAVCVHLMRALADERPLVWIIDDIHFAPKESRDTTLALARAVEGHRVLLVATARPAVPDEELAHFSRLENFQRIKLARLGGREIAELLEDAFKSEALAEKLGMKIAKKSDGVPFFIFEMIRGLKEGQFIRQEPDGSYVQTQVIDEIEVPSAVKDLIEGRLRGLDKTQRMILDAGAVQGMAFHPGLTARVLGENRIRVLQELAEVERRFGLVRDEGESVRFDQNQIQEVVYQDLTPHLRTEYHTLLAEAHTEQCGDDPKGDDAVFLVHHHLCGSQPKAVLAYLEPAFDHLEKSYRNETLLDLARRALAIKGLVGGRDRVEVLLRQASRLDLLGRREEQRAALDHALALADEAGDGALRAKVLRSLGWFLQCTGRSEAARATLEEALRLAQSASDRKLEAQATGNLGIVFYAFARYAEAREHLERARALFREIGDRRGEAAATGNLGDVFHALGRYAEAQQHVERNRALSREIGDRRGEAVATGSLGNVFYMLGRYAEAQEHYERHRALSREIGDRRGEAVATGNLGNVFYALGRYAEAQEHYERHRALSREFGNRRGEAAATGNLGNVFADLGRYAEAHEHHERHRALSREIGHRQGEGYALVRLAILAEAEQDRGRACRLYEEALALWRELGAKDMVAATLVDMARVEAARGAAESARTRLSEALALVRETKSPGTILAATVERARLLGGDVEAALAALEAHGEQVHHGERMEARFRLWELTTDKVHLEEAHRLLCYARDHAPEDCRETIIENVPLHRDIMRAWEEHGGR